MTNERLCSLLRELQEQEATLKELSNGKVLLLEAKIDILKTIEENEAERLGKAIPVHPFGDKLDAEWRKHIYGEQEEVEKQWEEAVKEQNNLHIEKRVQIEVAKSKIAAIKKLIGENTVNELENLERSKILGNYVQQRATAVQREINSREKR